MANIEQLSQPSRHSDYKNNIHSHLKRVSNALAMKYNAIIPNNNVMIVEGQNLYLQ